MRNEANNRDTNMNNTVNNNNTEVKGATTMINATGFNKTMEALTRKVEEEVTKISFMDRMNRDYGHSIQEDKNLGVGQITIASNVANAIILLPDEVFAPLAFKNLEIVLGKEPGFNQGYGEYYGLLVEEILADRVTMDHVTVSEKQEEMVISEILSCDLSDVKNLRKIYNDINDLFRMYQELTIDAAKKLYVIKANFYNDIMKANSTYKLTSNFESYKNFKDTNTKFAIERANKYAAPRTAALGEMVEHTINGKLKKVSFNDTISTVQDIISEQFEDLVNGDLLAKYDAVKLDDNIIATFGYGTETQKIAIDLYNSVRTVYSNIVIRKIEKENAAKHDLRNNKITVLQYATRMEKIEEFHNEGIDTLSNLARFITKDLDMATAGKLMFMVSNSERYGLDLKYNEESTNKMFLTIAPELFLAYLVSEHAEMDICGYKLLGDITNVTEGEVLTFINGNAAGYDNVYVDSIYDGQLTVQMVDDVLCAVKKIEIPRIEATTPDYIGISLMEYMVVDPVHFVKNKEIAITKSFDTLINSKIFEKAEKIKLEPVFTYTKADGSKGVFYDAVVCTVPSLNDPNVKFEIPVCKYSCISGLFESVIGGLVASKVEGIAINGQTMRIKLAYGKFEEFTPLHSKVIAETIEEVDTDVDVFVSTNNRREIKPVASVIDDPFAVVDKSTKSSADTTVNSIDDEAFGSDFGALDFNEFGDDFGFDYNNEESSVIGETQFA